MWAVLGFLAVVQGFEVQLTRQLVQVQPGSRKAQKVAFVGNLTFGDQLFSVVFDTGSGHLLLPSASCRSATCARHRRYSRKVSSTMVDINSDGTRVADPAGERDQLTVSFGTGTATGILVRDQLCLDTCKPLDAVVAIEMSEHPFAQFDFDGVLGLGLRALSQGPGFNFLGRWGPEAFRMSLGERPRIDFGAAARGGITTWQQVQHPELGHWLIPIQGVRVAGVLQSFCAEGCAALVDSGTSAIGLPRALGAGLMPTLRAPGCRGPAVEIELPGQVLRLGAREYARVDREDCDPAVMLYKSLGPLGNKVLILGEPVLRKYDAVFDPINHRLAFADRAAPGEVVAV
mmetsp:Transcript_1058/g.2359  ORF Transcript_1058/g.2359 Transcript_1058/m.2359 type:complete len:345 (-) Transcript_1058:34-1068(-)